MSTPGDGAAEQAAPASSSTETDATTGDIITVTIGATVPTGFEHTAAEEIEEKIGVDARISKDRGRLYFPITTDKLYQVRKESKPRETQSHQVCLTVMLTYKHRGLWFDGKSWSSGAF